MNDKNDASRRERKTITLHLNQTRPAILVKRIAELIKQTYILNKIIISTYVEYVYISHYKFSRFPQFFNFLFSDFGNSNHQLILQFLRALKEVNRNVNFCLKD